MPNFKPKPQKEPQPHLWDTPLPIDCLWGIYARQSTPSQVTNNIQSTEMQTEELLQWLFTRGVKESHIHLFDADLGRSGTLRIDQRTGLQELVEKIKADKIKAVLVYQVSRLFRDETAVQYNVFATICRQHNCVLVTADGMIFNFNNPMQLKMFRYLAEMAAEYIPQHVHMLHEMRERKARKGLYAGMGSIPRGYIVDYDKKSPTYNKFIVYWPHGEIVFSLFKRFFEIGGDFSRLCRELHELPFVFPLFDANVDARVISRTHFRKAAGGYRITRQGLLCLLANPVYIGWWIVKGDIISKDNHERIIDEEHEYLFWYAFNKLAVYTVQGKVNEKRTTGQRRYYQKHTAANVGILKDKIVSPDGKVYVHMSHGRATYRICGTESGVYVHEVNEIGVARIDAEFFTRFFTHLRSSHDFDIYQRYLEEAEQSHASLLATLTEQLQEAQRQQNEATDEVLAIRRDINTQVKEALQQNPLLDAEEVKRTYEKEAAPMLRDLRKRSSDLEATKEALQQKLTKEQEKQPQPHLHTYADFHTELEVLIQVWDKKDFADRKDFVNLFLSQATIQVITNHWIQLDLYWSIPGWGVETLFIYRTKSNGDVWTQAEQELLKAHYEKSPREVLLQALPQKSWLAIKYEAMVLGLRRTSQSGCFLPARLTWSDWQFMEQAGIEPTAKATRVVPLYLRGWLGAHHAGHPRSARRP